jgi:hypothetical protein
VAIVVHKAVQECVVHLADGATGATGLHVPARVNVLQVESAPKLAGSVEPVHRTVRDLAYGVLGPVAPTKVLAMAARAKARLVVFAEANHALAQEAAHGPDGEVVAEKARAHPTTPKAKPKPVAIVALKHAHAPAVEVAPGADGAVGPLAAVKVYARLVRARAKTAVIAGHRTGHAPVHVPGVRGNHVNRQRLVFQQQRKRNRVEIVVPEQEIAVSQPVHGMPGIAVVAKVRAARGLLQQQAAGTAVLK